MKKRTMGIVGGAAALLLATGVALPAIAGSNSFGPYAHSTPYCGVVQIQGGNNIPPGYSTAYTLLPNGNGSPYAVNVDIQSGAFQSSFGSYVATSRGGNAYLRSSHGFCGWGRVLAYNW